MKALYTNICGNQVKWYLKEKIINLNIFIINQKEIKINYSTKKAREQATE